MQIVSAREFRSSQSKYLSKVCDGQELFLKSRLGTFKITSVTDEDSLTDRICRGLCEVKKIREGRVKGYTVEELLDDL